MPIPPTPLGDLLDRPAESTRRRLAHDHRVPLPRRSPVMGEAQKVERPRPVVRFLRTPLRTTWACERHQPRLVGMDGQSILTETLRQHLQDPTGILRIGEAHDEVVRIADQEATYTQ